MFYKIGCWMMELAAFALSLTAVIFVYQENTFVYQTVEIVCKYSL